MKLNYRGVSYEYNQPEIEVTEEQVAGKYRGLDWRFRNLKKAPVVPQTVNLKYRGVAYQTGGTPEVTTAPVKKPVVSTEEKARSLMMAHQRLIKNRQQSILSRSAKEVGLAANVSEYWNRIQGKIHPTFRVNYDRSHAALS
ncbi:MAG TPA: DUF4278 domain-containing protein [Leptolyngbyaceae cyanobacterium]